MGAVIGVRFVNTSYTVNAPHPYWRKDTAGLLRYCRRHHISWILNAYGPGSFQRMANIRRAKPDLLRVLRRGF